MLTRKQFTEKELKLIKNTNLKAREVARLTGRSDASIYSMRCKLNKGVKTVKTSTTIINNPKIKEISINGITIGIIGNKLSITI